MIKRPAILFILAFIFVIFIISCTSTSKDQLNLTCNIDNMSYSNNVVPILKSKCYSCHSVGNSVGSYGILLDNYDSLKKYTINDTVNNVSILVGVITHDPRYVAMPYKLPKLDSCSINQITFWIFQGAHNN